MHLVVFVLLGLFLSFGSTSRSDESLRRILRTFECKPKWDACWGIIPCCGENHCYWPEGKSVIKSGYCVKCVKKNGMCQRDEMCCEGMMCDKGYHGHVDGYCQPPKPLQGWCYRDEQCASGICSQVEWPNYHGRCVKKRKPKKEWKKKGSLGR